MVLDILFCPPGNFFLFSGNFSPLQIVKKKKARVPGEGCRYRLFPPTLSHGKETPVSQQHVISDSDVPVHVCVLLLLYLFREKLRYASGEIERKKMIRANHAKNSSDDRENKKGSRRNILHKRLNFLSTVLCCA